MNYKLEIIVLFNIGLKLKLKIIYSVLVNELVK